MKRRIEFKVVYAKQIGFVGEFRYDYIKSFNTYKEAEDFILDGEADKYGESCELQIHKVFTLAEEE